MRVTLEGQSHVFGIKFVPGGFRPFSNSPASTLANRTIPAQRIFGEDVSAPQAVLASSREEAEKVEAANVFLRARVPEPDKTIALVSQLVGHILEEPDIKTVNDLVTRAGIGKRSVQRIFND